jgi:hypothetical protein
MVFPYTDDGATEEEKLANLESPIQLTRRTERMMDSFADEIREQKGLERSDGIKYDELIQYIIIKAGGKQL